MHTEGEWHIIKDTDNRLHIMSKGKDSTMSINVARMPVSPDAQANAQLIASAPDLYEALRRIVSLYGRDSELVNTNTLNQAQLALAKADGK